jgi:phasin family protein
MADKFPFAFDFNAMSDAMKMPGLEKFMPTEMPAFDMSAFQEAQQKNVAALIEANKAAFSGYQALYKRQTELFEAALAETKDKIGAAQGKPVSAETAQENFEAMKGAFEKALADLKEVAEMAQTANTDAFEIIKARAEEAFAEFKEATEKFVH